jgi:hypothetical protein
MVQVPAVTPVTMPAELMVAIEVLLVLQVPPGVASARPVEEPTQVPDAPVMGAMPVVPPTVMLINT